MRELKILIFVFIVLVGIGYLACRKTGTPATEISSSANFFKMHASHDPEVIAVMKYLKNVDSKKSFVSDLVKRSGYAYWDKALVFEKVGVIADSKEIKPNNKVLYIPMVLPSQNSVNAGILIKMNNTDTGFYILYASDYRRFGFDNTNSAKWNAADVFNIFACMEASVFQHHRFRVLDGRLTGDSEAYQKDVTIGSYSSGTRETRPITQAYVFCVTWSICEPSSGAFPNQTGHCYDQTECTTIWGVENMLSIESRGGEINGGQHGGAWYPLESNAGPIK
jgi:hypothetical protein